MAIAATICTPIPKKELPNGEIILEPISVEWQRARKNLSFPTNFNVIELYQDKKPVDVARNAAVSATLQCDPIPQFLFFLDYDVLPSFDAFTKLFYRAVTNPDYDIFAGVYCCKWINPSDPLIYKELGAGPFWDWKVGELLTTETHGIKYIHMGLTLIRVSLFERLLETGDLDPEFPFFRTVVQNGHHSTHRSTEDIHFCKLVDEKIGMKLMVDTSVLAGHIDKNNGVTYGLPKDSPPVKNSFLNETKEQTKIALDLGCGPTYRNWQDHKTIRVDIRKECNPDYVMDLCWLNFPDDYADMVASSHTLEHIPRWEQERVWQEIFRVCKKGGMIQHIVPSIEWASHKVVNNELEGSVFNVFYGAQEKNGYDRKYNTHYFGYTKRIAEELAKRVGFIEIETKDWRDVPSLGYNLLIQAKKPV